MVKVKGKGKFADRTLYLHAKKSKRSGVMLYYFDDNPKNAVDGLPKGMSIAFHTSGGLKGWPYLKRKR